MNEEKVKMRRHDSIGKGYTKNGLEYNHRKWFQFFEVRRIGRIVLLSNL